MTTIAVSINSNVLISTEVLFSDISFAAKTLYNMLAVLAKPDTNEIRLAQKELAQKMGISIRSISRYMKELLVKQFIQPLEAPIPGQVRPFAVATKSEPEPKKQAPITPICTPVPEPTVIDEPLPEPLSPEKQLARMLDAMAEAVLEQALKDPVPTGKEWPNSIESFLQHLYRTTPPGFLTRGCELVTRYRRAQRKSANA